MKIGLLGNYGHSNLGDEALLLGAVECAKNDAQVAEADIVVLSDDRDDTVRRLQGLECEVRQLRRPFGGRLARLPMLAVDVFRALRGLDWLVCGGGGLLNDSNRTAIPMYALIRLIAAIRGIRVAWWSVGIGPLSPGLRYRLASWLLSSSRFVSVRDEDSATIAVSMLEECVTVSPDLAHGLERPLAANSRGEEVIAISVIPYKKEGVWFAEDAEQYSDYCAKMVEIIQRLLNARPECRVRLFPVSLKQDAAAIADIMLCGDFAGNRRVEQMQPDSVYALLGELGAATIVLATRLHSLVLATVAAVPAITIAYQPKVQSFARELSVALPCYGIDEFTTESVVDSVLTTIDQADGISSKLQQENAQRRMQLARMVHKWRALA